MQTRLLPVDIFDNQVTEWYMEGMDSTINSPTSGILYRDLANLRRLDNPKDVINSFTGGGLYGTHGEWEEARLFEPGAGWRISFNPQLLKSSFRVPETLTQYGKAPPYVADQVKLLGDYGIHSIDQMFINMLNNGFDASYSAYDALPLFSVSHPLRNAAGTFANRPVSGGALSETTLAAALTYFMSIKNDDGYGISMTPYALVVPTGLRLLADQILLSSSISGSNAGLRNLVTGYSSLQVYSSSKLTSATAWFVLAAPSPNMRSNGHGLDLWFTPEGQPSVKTKLLEDPYGTKFIGAFNMASSVTKVRGAYGNPGA
jgi:hypothetical protein